MVAPSSSSRRLEPPPLTAERPSSPPLRAPTPLRALSLEERAPRSLQLPDSGPNGRLPLASLVAPDPAAFAPQYGRLLPKRRAPPLAPTRRSHHRLDPALEARIQLLTTAHRTLSLTLPNGSPLTLAPLRGADPGQHSTVYEIQTGPSPFPPIDPSRLVVKIPSPLLLQGKHPYFSARQLPQMFTHIQKTYRAARDILPYATIYNIERLPQELIIFMEKVPRKWAPDWEEGTRWEAVSAPSKKRIGDVCHIFRTAIENGLQIDLSSGNIRWTDQEEPRIIDVPESKGIEPHLSYRRWAESFACGNREIYHRMEAAFASSWPRAKPEAVSPPSPRNAE